MIFRTNSRPTIPGPAIIGLVLAAVVLAAGGCSERPEGEELTQHETEQEHDEGGHGDEGGHEEGVVELTDEKAAAAQIETATVSQTMLSAQLATTGQVDFNQDRLAHVSPRIPGRVHEVRAQLGQQVRRGEVLAILDSIELGRAKAEFLQAKAREQLTRENYERERNLYADRISSEREMLAARAAHVEAEAELRSDEETLHLYGLGDSEVAAVTYENPGRSLFPIRAPFSGKVVEKHVTIGELVTPERNLFSLADLSNVWVWIDVYERDLRQVHLDDQVTLRVEAFPDARFSGTVSYLSDRVDLDTRRVRARIDVENPDRELRPGMFAQVELTDPHHGGGAAVEAQTLAVPEGAVQRDGESMVVFLDLGEHRYLRRVVRTGRKTGGLIEVTDGLTAGDTIVSAGAFFLKSELAKDELGEGHAH